ncbi:septin interacting protein 2 isoform 2-T2 [Cochliomyia hominivorax]
MLFVKPEVVQNTSTITESQRYSLDIGEDLKNIIEQKKIKKTVQINLKEEIINISNKYQQETITNNQITKDNKSSEENMNRCDETAYGELPMWQKTSDESFEALEKMCEKTVSDPNSTLFKYLHGEDEELKSNNVVAWQKTSDESFEALERMCDKTASDPNSTLFQYLHSDRKEQVLAEVKKRSADGNIRKQEELLLMKINNCTLLDDVEAPSRMWENTICGDTILQTSPVKMVGLLRPSTIIEETPDDSTNSEVSSQISFRTATKGAHSDVSSSAYETAHDSTVASNRTDKSNRADQQELQVIDVDHILFSAFEKHESHIMERNDKAAENIPSVEIMDATIIESATTNNNSETKNINTNDTSIDLIDLEKTFGPLHNSPHSSILVDELEEDDDYKEGRRNDKFKESEIGDENNELDDSVIEILSDDDEDVQDNYDSDSKKDQLEYNIKTENYSNCSSSFSINQDTYSFNEIENKENCVDSREPLEKSMQFNDTMEEVEYMLKKGIEYMAAKAAAKKSPEKVNLPEPARNIPATKTIGNTPITNKKPRVPISSSASKVKSSTYTTPAKKTPLLKGPSSTSKRFDIDIKPFPKLDIFTKPPVHARTKELTSKQQKFSHVVSPIGTYMKKTAKTPLMSSIHSKNKDYFNSTAILELENESRLYQLQLSKDSNVCEESGVRKLPGLPSTTKRPLPKKAYISSDLKHIVDERTPVTIPGGKKIQKYLENAMMPAVLRHEGKFKMPGNVSNKLNTPSSSKLPLKESDTNSAVTGRSSSHIPRRNNASLADLSLMSGDVSMYTIMDAQKF